MATQAKEMKTRSASLQFRAADFKSQGADL